jgi:hypothetical protein
VKGEFTMPALKHFRFWCQKVLPLVYDDSLSYYEVLCKVVEYINNLIDTDREIFSELDGIKSDLAIVKNWIKNFDENARKIMEEIIDKYIVTMVFFGITDDGYFVAYIPESWEDITFYTTELDIFLPIQPEYGHLVLAY